MSSAPKPFLPYGRQTISEADIAAKEEVLSSPFLTQGSTVPAFDQAVASKIGAHHGMAVKSTVPPAPCTLPAWP
jgi:dTDP-4-amino-4,6-dideoxygalactose transaminase